MYLVNFVRLLFSTNTLFTVGKMPYPALADYRLLKRRNTVSRQWIGNTALLPALLLDTGRWTMTKIMQSLMVI